MGLYNKLLGAIGVFVFSAGIALADSNWSAYEKQPFIVDDYLLLYNHSGKILPKNLFIYEKIRGQYSIHEEWLPGDLKIINNYQVINTKKPALGKIKVTFSPGNTFLLPGDEIYLRSKEGKLSQAVRTLPSFFQNPSQETAVDVLKVIEPQVNFFFEF